MPVLARAPFVPALAAPAPGTAPADAAACPGGAAAGVFPPVGAGDGTCPKLPQAFYAAPGSNFGSHHSYPGGLAIHEGFNVSSALSFAENYKLAYGTPGPDGLPRMAPLSSPGSRQSDLEISQDEVVAAPLWHDWAKTTTAPWATAARAGTTS